MRVSSIFFVIVALSGWLPAHADMRSWHSADGERTIKAEFVKLDGTQITLRRPDGKTFTFGTDKLSPSDRAFAEAESRKPKTILKSIFGRKGQAFDTLAFGTRKDGTPKKLAMSKHVENTGGAVSFFGHTITADEFVAKIDGDRYKLLTIHDGGVLSEVRFAGRPYEDDELPTIKSAWSDLHMRLSFSFGEHTKEFRFPDLANLGDNASGVTHRWTLSGGRTLSLGIHRRKQLLSTVLRLER